MADLNSTAPVLRSSRDLAPSALSDPRVLLHRTGDTDPCVSFCDDEGHVGLHGPRDGPMHLIIGRRAPDAALQRASVRLGLNLGDLVAFRDQRPDGEADHV